MSLLAAVSLDAQVLVRGTVRDADTGLGLPAATIQIKNTFYGTVANDDGEYIMEVESFPVTLLVTFIGYGQQELILNSDPGFEVDFQLRSVPYILEEIVVSGEDDGVRIMRQVIERKQEWHSQLNNYQADVYSRWTIKKYETVVGVVEIASEIYWDRKKGMGELVKARRSTTTVAPGGIFGDFNSSDLYLNLYEDEIDLLGHCIIGPTHPQALQHYNFSLVSQRHLDSLMVYDIALSPKSKLQPAFVGTLAVLDQEFALLEATLKPNGITTSSPTPGLDIKLAYRQQFRPFGTGIWLPVDFRIAIDLSLNAVGLQIPEMKRDIVQRLSNYQVNTPLPDSLFVGTRMALTTALPTAADSLLSPFRDAVPLSDAEEEAYAGLDSSLTLNQIFKPTGFLGRFVVLPTGADADARREARWRIAPDLRANRVDFLHPGVGVERTFRAPLTLAIKSGYSLGQERWTYGGKARAELGREGDVAVEVEYRAGTQERYGSDNYPLWFNGLQVVLGRKDYFDYLWNERVGIEVEKRIGSNSYVSAGVNDERHKSLERSTRDWWNINEGQRENPSVDPGKLRSMVFSLDYGEAYPPWSVLAHRRLHAGIEYSIDAFGSDFSFTRYWLALDWHVPTLLKRRSPPHAFDLRIIAGAATGDLPLQRHGTLDSGVGGFTPFGTFRSLRGLPYEGERYLGVFWEQYLRAIPFELLGLHSLAQRGMGLIAHGASGRTWISRDETQNGGFVPHAPSSFHHELGVSLILFYWGRVDFTRRLDQADWSVGVSVARIEFFTD